MRDAGCRTTCILAGIIEWSNNRFLVAAAIDYGTETQAWLPDEPRVNWGAGAVWAQWMVNDRASLALRPEIYKDSDGLITGTQQTIRAITTTAKFRFSPARQRITAMLEARYDHSNADGGIFSDGSPQNLKADQFLLQLGFLWSFDG